jgi:branched-chain amino acid transport system permease protein
MRFVFKTTYDQDIDLAQHGGQRFWYALLLLALFTAPLWLGAYGLSQLTFMLIYSIVGLGLMLLVGYTGLLSIGHAAFLGIGAYTQAVLAAQGWPLPLSLAAAAGLSASVGIIVGLPALRVKGIYLGIATLAFGFIVEEVLVRWEAVTGGNAGMLVGRPELLGWTIGSGAPFYFLCLVITIGCTLLVLNLLRSPTGRAFVAIRDSEISAQSMGIHLAYYKTLSFALSAALAGIGGALYAHMMRFISPEQFGIIQSIDLLLMIVVGGLGSIHGVFLGAIFLIGLPQLISEIKDFLPWGIGDSPGLKLVIFGLVLVTFVLFEPWGLYGRWLKIRAWFMLFPFYRKGMFKRQKAFKKTDRLK